MTRCDRAAIAARDGFLAKASAELETRVSKLRALTSRASDQELRASVRELEAFARELRLVAAPALPVALRRRRLDLVARLGGWFGAHGAKLEARGFDIDVSRRGAVVGQWDSTLVDVILGELLSNAIKYAGSGVATVKVLALGRSAILSTHTETASRVEGLGERFRRGASASAIPGFGVGLWLVRRLAVAHGGRLSFTSSSPRGTTTRVSLPRADSPLEGGRLVARLRRSVLV